MFVYIYIYIFLILLLYIYSLLIFTTYTFCNNNGLYKIFYYLTLSSVVVVTCNRSRAWAMAGARVEARETARTRARAEVSDWGLNSFFPMRFCASRVR